MPKSKRSVPVTERAMKVNKDTQKIISSYHTLTKSLAVAKSNKSNNTVEAIEKELEDMGGLPLYQQASLKGGNLEKGFGAVGRWLEKAVKEFPLKRIQKLKVLDVGAITGQVYEKMKYMNVTSIDLNSQSPLVLQQDFFLRPIPDSDNDKFDLLCLSLVLNFVVEPALRGKMIGLTRDHLTEGGYLYIVLPLPCLENSRYLKHKGFTDLVESIGFSSLKHHHSKKLAFYLFKMEERPEIEVVTAKKQVANGTKRNNFSITFGI